MEPVNWVFKGNLGQVDIKEGAIFLLMAYYSWRLFCCHHLRAFK